MLLRYVQSDGIFRAKSLLHSKWNAKVTSKFPTPGTIKAGKGSESSRLFYGAWSCLPTNPGQWAWLGKPHGHSWELCRWCVWQSQTQRQFQKPARRARRLKLHCDLKSITFQLVIKWPWCAHSAYVSHALRITDDDLRTAEIQQNLCYICDLKITLLNHFCGIVGRI